MKFSQINSSNAALTAVANPDMAVKIALAFPERALAIAVALPEKAEEIMDQEVNDKALDIAEALINSHPEMIINFIKRNPGYAFCAATRFPQLAREIFTIMPSVFEYLILKD